MGAENKLVWLPLKERLDAFDLHSQRFEDKLTPGIPDVNVHLTDVGDVWVELKHIGRDGKVWLRKEQRIWLREGKMCGRLCMLLARADKAVKGWESGWYVFTDINSWDMAVHGMTYTVSGRRVAFNSPDEVVYWMLNKAFWESTYQNEHYFQKN